MDSVDLTDIKQEGGNGSPFDNLFAESDGKQNETASESSTENKQTETTPSQEGVGESKDPKAEVKPEAKGAEVKPNIPDVNQTVPLNKDKRFKEMQAKSKALEERLQAIQQEHAKELAELKGLVQGKKSAQPEIPPAFKELFGEGNEHLYSKWQSLFPQTPDLAALKQEMLSELKKEQEQQVKAQEQQQQWINDQIEELQEEGLKFDKNELFQILEKYQPTDEKGNLDFRKGYELLQLANASKPENKRKEARKKVAAQTAPQGGSEPVSDDTVDLKAAREARWDWRKMMKS